MEQNKTIEINKGTPEKDFAAALHLSGYDFGRLTGEYGYYENFKLQPPEVYRNTDLFKDQPEEEFNKWYKEIQNAYNAYENGRVANPTSISAGFALDDPISRRIGLVSAPNLSVSFQPNKREYTKDFSGVESAKYSIHEVAQRNTKYRDSKTGKMIENDDGVGGLLDFFSIAAKKGGLWLAHDENNNPITDMYGNYFYETIEGRDTTGKEHLMLTFDNAITEENSILNSIDFMDSDQIEQNVGRSLIKEGLKVAANFNPLTRAILATGWLATTGISLIGEAYKSVSALSNAFSNGTFDPNKYKPSNEAEDTGNRLINWGKMLTISGRTEEAEKDSFSLESILNMIGSGATQIAGQRLLMEAPLFIKSIADPKFQQALKSGDKSAKRFLNVTKNAAIAYMTAQSAQEVGEQFELAGFDKGTKDIFTGIAAITLAAFYKTSPFETWMLDKFDDKIAHSQVKKIIKDTMDDFKKIYSPESIEAMPDVQKAAIASNFMTTVKKKIQSLGDFLGKGYRDNQIIKGFIGEGLEEPTEVLFGEVFKAAAQVMNKFNLLDEKDAKKYEKLDPFGEGFFQELAVSALGGALAGGMTGIIDRVKGVKNEERLDTLSDIIQSGYTDIALRQIENLRNADIASKNLSAIYYDIVDGKKVYRSYNPNDPLDISQSDFIANSMIADIRKLKTAYEGIGATKDDFDKISQRFNTIAADANLFQAAAMSSIIEDAKNVSRELIKVKLEIEKIEKDIEGRDPEGRDDRNKEKLKELKKKEQYLTEQLNYYKSIGQDPNPIIENYLEEALFNKNYILQQGFGVKNKVDFITNEDGTPKKGSDLKKALEQWEEYRTTQRPKEIRDAFSTAKKMLDKNSGDTYVRKIHNEDFRNKVDRNYNDNIVLKLISSYKNAKDPNEKAFYLHSLKEFMETKKYIPTKEVIRELSLNGNEVSTWKDILYDSHNSFSDFSVSKLNNLLVNEYSHLGYNFITNPYLNIGDSTIDLFTGKSDGSINLNTKIGELSEEDRETFIDNLKYIKDSSGESILKDEDIKDSSTVFELFEKVVLPKLDDDLKKEWEILKNRIKTYQENRELFDFADEYLKNLAEGREDEAIIEDNNIVDSSIESEIFTLQSTYEQDPGGFKGKEIIEKLENIISLINRKKAAYEIPTYITPIINKLKKINPKYFSGKEDTSQPQITKSQQSAIRVMFDNLLAKANKLLQIAKANEGLNAKSIDAQYVYGAIKLANTIVSKLGLNVVSVEDELKEHINSSLEDIAKLKNLEELAPLAYKYLIDVSEAVKKDYNSDKTKEKYKKIKLDTIDPEIDARFDVDHDQVANFTILAMIRGDIAEFFKKIHPIKEKLSVVPTFQQEMVLFQAYSLKQYFTGPAKEKDNLLFPNNYSKMMFVNSNPGIGKTEILIKYLSALLDSDGEDVIVTAPNKGFVDNILIPSMQKEGFEGLVKYHTFENENVEWEEYSLSETKDIYTSKSNVIMPKMAIDKDAKSKKIYIIDESTHLSLSAVEKLQKTGAIVYFFGDSNQLGRIETIGKQKKYKVPLFKYVPGMEKTPRITTSFRNKTENYENNAANMLALANALYNSNIESLNSTFESLKSTYPLSFKYDPNTNKGVTEYSKELEDKIKEKAKNEKASIVIIDHTQAPRIEDGIEITHFDKLQGREFDYVIIRNSPDFRSDPVANSALVKVQTANTVLSRYRKAMLIPVEKIGNNKYFQDIPVTFSQSPVVEQFVMNKEKAESMRKVSLSATGKIPGVTLSKTTTSISQQETSSSTGIPLSYTPEVPLTLDEDSIEVKPGRRAGQKIIKKTESDEKPKTKQEEEVSTTVPEPSYVDYTDKEIEETAEDKEIDENADKIRKSAVFIYPGPDQREIENKDLAIKINKSVNDLLRRLLNGEKDLKTTLKSLDAKLSIFKLGNGLYKMVVKYNNKEGYTDIFRFPDLNRTIPSLTETQKQRLMEKLESVSNMGDLDPNIEGHVSILNELNELFSNSNVNDPEMVTKVFLRRTKRKNPVNSYEEFVKDLNANGIYITKPVVITPGHAYQAFNEVILDYIDIPEAQEILENIMMELNKLNGRTVSFISADSSLFESFNKSQFTTPDVKEISKIYKQYLISRLETALEHKNVNIAKKNATTRVSILFNKSESIDIQALAEGIKEVASLKKNTKRKKEFISEMLSTTLDPSDIRRIGEAIFEFIKENIDSSDPNKATLAKKLKDLKFKYYEESFESDGKTKRNKKIKQEKEIPLTGFLFGFEFDESGNILEYYPSPKRDTSVTGKVDLEEKSYEIVKRLLKANEKPLVLKTANARFETSFDSNLNNELGFTGAAKLVLLASTLTEGEYSYHTSSQVLHMMMYNLASENLLDAFMEIPLPGGSSKIKDMKLNKQVGIVIDRTGDKKKDDLMDKLVAIPSSSIYFDPSIEVSRSLFIPIKKFLKALKLDEDISVEPAVEESKSILPITEKSELVEFPVQEDQSNKSKQVENFVSIKNIKLLQDLKSLSNDERLRKVFYLVPDYGKGSLYITSLDNENNLVRITKNRDNNSLTVEDKINTPNIVKFEIERSEDIDRLLKILESYFEEDLLKIEDELKNPEFDEQTQSFILNKDGETFSFTKEELENYIEKRIRYNEPEQEIEDVEYTVVEDLTQETEIQFTEESVTESVEKSNVQISIVDNVNVTKPSSEITYFKLERGIEEYFALWVESFGTDKKERRLLPNDVRNIIFKDNTTLEEKVYRYMINHMLADMFIYNPNTGQVGLTKKQSKELNKKIAEERKKVNQEFRTRFNIPQDADITPYLTMISSLANESNSDFIAKFIAYNLGHHLIKLNVFPDLNKSVKIYLDPNNEYSISYGMDNVVKQHSEMKSSGDIDGIAHGSSFLSSFLSRFNTLNPIDGNIDNLNGVNKSITKSNVVYTLLELKEILTAKGYDSKILENPISILDESLKLARKEPNLFNPNQLSLLVTLNAIIGKPTDTKPTVYTMDGQKYELHSIHKVINDLRGKLKKAKSQKAVNNLLNQLEMLENIKSTMYGLLKLSKIDPTYVKNGIPKTEKELREETLSYVYGRSLTNLIEAIANYKSGKDDSLKEFFNERDKYVSIKGKIPEIKGETEEERNNNVKELLKLILKQAALDSTIVDRFISNGYKINHNNKTLFKFINMLYTGNEDASVIAEMRDFLVTIATSDIANLSKPSTYPTVEGESSAKITPPNMILSVAGKLFDSVKKVITCK